MEDAPIGAGRLGAKPHIRPPAGITGSPHHRAAASSKAIGRLSLSADTGRPTLRPRPRRGMAADEVEGNAAPTQWFRGVPPPEADAVRQKHNPLGDQRRLDPGQRAAERVAPRRARWRAPAVV